MSEFIRFNRVKNYTVIFWQKVDYFEYNITKN